MKTIPMSTQEVMDFFQNPDTVIDIDLGNSTLKGEVFVTYITNMRMTTRIHGGSEEDRLNLLLPFLNSPYSTSCQELLQGGIDLLLCYRGLDTFYNTWLPKEVLTAFAQAHREELDIVADFLDSLVYTIPRFNLKYNESIFQNQLATKEIETVEDANLLGPNALSLLEPPNFMEVFIGSCKDVKKYFKYQCEIMRYRTRSLFDIVTSRDSLIMPMLNLLLYPEKENIDILTKHKDLFTDVNKNI